MHLVANYLLRLGRWVGSLWRLWVALGIPLAFFLLVYFAGPTEPLLRIGGVFFELLGLLTVAMGLRDTRNFFGLPSLVERASGALKAFPKLRQKEILGASVGSVGMSGAAGEMVAWHNPPTDDQSVEARLKAAEQNLINVSNRLSDTRRLVNVEIAERKQALQSEAVARGAADLQIREQLKMAHTGGLDLSATGALWLAIGLVLSTAPGEILHLLR